MSSFNVSITSLDYDSNTWISMCEGPCFANFGSSSAIVLSDENMRVSWFIIFVFKHSQYFCSTHFTTL